MIRVIQIISGWGSGGVEKYISNCAAVLCEQVVFDVLAVRGVSNQPLFSKEIINNGGKIFYVPKSKEGNYFKRKRKRKNYIEEHLKNNSYDIIHINGTTADFMEYARIAKHVSPNAKVVMHCHGDNVDSSHVYIKKAIHFLNRQLYSLNIDCCLGCSSRTMNWMYTKRALNLKYSKVINCGIDTKFFKFNEDSRDKIRKEIRRENKFIVGTIGRICEQKNPEFILKLVYELKKRLPDIVFLWVGLGDMQEFIKNKARELDLLDNIIFYGTSSNIPSILSAMDIFILPSNYEGNPIVGFEAQANGLKCFFSDKIVPESKITDSVDFLSIDNAEQIWAEKILLYKDGYKRFDTQSIIEESGYDFKECAYALKKVYKHILEN